MTRFNKTNHLANPLDRITNSKYALPNSLMQRYYELQRLTEIVRTALLGLANDDLINSLQVVDIDRIQITLTVPNQTMGNHLLYLSDYAIARLVGLDEAFTHIKSLQVIVVAPR